MKSDTIRQQISSNLAEHGFTIADLRIQPDPYAGWRLWLESDDFRGMAARERRALLLDGLENEHFEWLDLITSEEKLWTGAAPLDSDLEDLPLWPEALSRARSRTAPIEARFLSDLDEDPTTPLLGTFYSLKGGVGRTTALGYSALILANKGFKVVCVDMDLEAPGLAEVFGQTREIGPEMGVVHLLAALDRGEEVDLRDHLIRPDESLDLYLLPAGVTNADYARLLRFTDPLSWYREEENPLRKMVEQLRQLSFQPDLILFDARTGFNALNAPFLFEFSDLAVIVFFPHPQARQGTGELVRALLTSNTLRDQDAGPLTPMPRFLVSPIPASKAPEVIKRYQHRALEWVADWFSLLAEDQRPAEGDVTHFVPYREAVATSDSLLQEASHWDDYQQIAEWFQGFLKQGEEPLAPAVIAERKPDLLASLQFRSDTAERQEAFLETFVETAVVVAALAAEIPLVLGRKGTGKTAIFRRLSEASSPTAVVVMAPAPLRRGRPWIPGVDGFKRVEQSIQQHQADWRQFWSFCTAVAVYTEAGIDSPVPAPDQRLMAAVDLSPKSELAFIESLDKVLGMAGSGLLVSDWLERLDRAAAFPTLLLFDGLDTGFGNTDADRQRRQLANQGLFSFLTDRGEQFSHLRLKVVLREDLWQGLRFENKSHLFGRSRSLKWSEQVDFLRVVLKQAMRSEAFGRFVATQGWPVDKQNPIDHWPRESVFRAWNLLVGERMKGGNTAFSRNWVWNRLADANGDRTPRYLIQLFDEALAWERRESRVNPYDRSLIRPRGLVAALPEVSSRAISALKDEEFPQLERLFERLRALRSSPVNARDIDDLGELVRLAREVGVLSVYEGTEDQVERFKVPDIYLAGLGMARKGQA